MEKQQVYDEIRGTFVIATPEEIVRQNLLRKMTQALGYPKELLSVERALADLCPSIPGVPPRRVDVAVFYKKKETLLPLMLLECKESATLAKKALEQVKGYNHFFKAPFIAVSHPDGELFGYIGKQGLTSLPYLPTYQNLVEGV